ncbi:MAG: hypothetical protein M3081_03315, partial [Gemmatimonadota bacterium]|nr:hypothetical protein [Gemmatimonadota bacterium]
MHFRSILAFGIGVPAMLAAQQPAPPKPAAPIATVCPAPDSSAKPDSLLRPRAPLVATPDTLRGLYVNRWAALGTKIWEL